VRSVPIDDGALTWTLGAVTARRDAGRTRAAGDARLSEGEEMASRLRLCVARVGTAVVLLTVAGDVDLADAADLYSATRTALRDHGVRELVLDFVGVTFLDCAGVSALVATADTAQAQGAIAVVVNCQPRVYRVLNLTGVAGLLVR
jgi:anti-anti-sigma factor